MALSRVPKDRCEWLPNANTILALGDHNPVVNLLAVEIIRAQLQRADQLTQTHQQALSGWHDCNNHTMLRQALSWPQPLLAASSDALLGYIFRLFDAFFLNAELSEA